jgi:hypothetical protein
MPRGSITVSFGSSSTSCLRNLHTVFHSGYTNLHSHQQHIRVPVLPHPFQHLLLLLPLIMAILTGVRWNVNVVSYFSYITREIKHFMYLLVICTSSFENSLFNSCTHFFIVVLIVWRLRFLSTLFILVLVPYQINSWQRFSPILWAIAWVWWLFPLLWRSSLLWFCTISSLYLFNT